MTRHILAPTREQEEIARRHQRDPKHRNAMDEHNGALRVPRGVERPLIRMARSIDEWLTWAEQESGEGRGAWRDYVIGEGMIDLLRGFHVLLGTDTGRLDAGTLSTWIHDTARRANIDPDLWEFAE